MQEHYTGENLYLGIYITEGISHPIAISAIIPGGQTHLDCAKNT